MFFQQLTLVRAATVGTFCRIDGTAIILIQVTGLMETGVRLEIADTHAQITRKWNFLRAQQAVRMQHAVTTQPAVEAQRGTVGGWQVKLSFGHLSVLSRPS